jgi:hypothetical protein
MEETIKGLEISLRLLLTPYFFFQLRDYANAVDTEINKPAAKRTIPKPAPPAVAMMGVIPNKRNPKANLPSRASIVSS